MSDILDSEAGHRFRRAIAGDPDVLCLGVTFLPAGLSAGAIASLASPVSDTCRGEEPTSSVGQNGSLVSAVCRRLRPDFAFVCSWEPGAGSVCVEVTACGTVPLWVVRGPLDALAATHGWSHALASTVTDSQGLAEQVDRLVAEACSSVESAVTCGAGGVVVAEDVATATGFLLDPEYVTHEILPRVGTIAGAATETGLVSVWHSDGDVRSFIPHAAAEGLDAVHPGGLGAEAFERVFREARRAGMAVFGGISGGALREGGPAAVRAVGVSASLLAREGGLLVCDDGGIASAKDLGALESALQAARGA